MKLNQQDISFLKINFKDHVNESSLFVHGIKKIIIPSNINDIFTRLEIILGLNLSGHTNFLKEAAYLIYELYKRGEIQNEQQYRNAPNKLHTQ